MKMFLISDNIDTQTGMRLAGVSGVVVHTKKEVTTAVESALKNREIGILIITEKLGKLVPELLDNIKMTYTMPLIVEVPDRHGSDKGNDPITRYVRDAVGIKI